MADAPWTEKYDLIVRSYCRLSEPAAPIDAGTPFTALGVDSLGLLGLIADTELAYDVTFPQTMLTVEALFTPGAFWQALQTLTADAQ